MLPVYRYMDPYHQPSPHCQNHFPYRHHYYPHLDVFQPQTEVDLTKPRVNSSPWPCNGSFAFPSHPQCDGCCNHCYAPGYYNYRPSHFYPPPPPPLCNYGPCHSYPKHHYGYHFPHHDNGIPTSHCCGCPNHTHNQNSSNNVKIEEQEHEPEIGKNDTNSLYPKKLSNLQYPILWVPPDYLKDKEAAPSISDGKRNENQGNEEKQSQMSSEMEPKVWNGRFPHGMNSIKPLNYGEEEKRSRDQQCESRKTEFPYPIFWFPAYDKPEEVVEKDVKEINEVPKSTEEKPSKLETIPVKLPEIEDVEDKSGNMQDSSAGGVHSNQTDQPKIKNIPVKHIEENGDNNALDYIRKKQAMSPPKASKLPPVCLRVDPLPRRKKVNESSRSPSPPLTEKAQKNHEKTLKSLSPPHMEDKAITKRAEVGDEEQRDMVKDEITSMEVEEKKDEERSKIIHMSDVEAAIHIQSAYRGFEVRKWEPLKKLRQLARVREQVAEVRNQVNVLESSAEPHLDDKQKLLISETIMSLLLQLDTIQGLHSSVRDIRKSVANDLTFLQEKLDSLCNQKSEGLALIGAEVEAPTSNLAVEDLSEAFQESVPEKNVTCSFEVGEEPLPYEKEVEDGDQGKSIEATSEAREEPLTYEEEVEADVIQMESIETPQVRDGEVESKAVDSVEQLCSVKPKDEKVEVEAVEDLSKTFQESVPEKNVTCSFEVGEELSPYEKEVEGDDQGKSIETTSEAREESLQYEKEVAADDSQRESIETPQVRNGEVESKAVDSVEQLCSVKPKDEKVDAGGTWVSMEIQKIEHEPEIWQMDSDQDTLTMINREMEDYPGEPQFLPLQKEESQNEEPLEVPIPEKEILSLPELKEGNTVDEYIEIHENISVESEDSGDALNSENRDNFVKSLEGNGCREDGEVVRASENISQELTNEEEEVITRESSIPEDKGYSSCDAIDEPETVKVYEKKTDKENERLEEMLEKLIEAGRQQITVISDLNERVRDLETKLARKKRLKMMRRHKFARSKPLSDVGTVY